MPRAGFSEALLIGMRMKCPTASIRPATMPPNSGGALGVGRRDHAIGDEVMLPAARLRAEYLVRCLCGRQGALVRPAGPAGDAGGSASTGRRRASSGELAD